MELGVSPDRISLNPNATDPPAIRRRVFFSRKASQMSEERIALRRAGKSDAAAILALTRAAYAKWIPVLGREPMPMQADYDQAVREHMVDLLSCDDVLAGLIEMKSETDHLLIVNVAVLPVLQKQGFGRLLLAHAEEMAAALGLAEVRLYTGKLMVENVRLYQRLGYFVYREEPFKNTTTIHMKKPIIR
jgi:ribosomal protein S18 acetylase RimI-like enzyme